MMANWPESFRHNPLQFRAPPPSPVASGRRSSVTNDEILTEFLHRSLRVPDLILPDRLHKSKVQNLPKLDYKLLNSLEDCNDNGLLDLISRIGCFELVNHGVSDQIVSFSSKYGAKIFELSNEEKGVLVRSGDRKYGFVEFHGDEEKETSEEFVWCRDDDLRSEMEEILQNSNFSENLEILTSVIEKIAEIIVKFLLKNGPPESGFEDDDDNGANEKQNCGTICYVHRHRSDVNKFQSDHNQNTNYLKYDMIRMLIRGFEHSHSLCLHVCHGSSEFHVYSKKGWVTFLHEKDALVITIGDLLQKWSEGKCKHVMGMPIFKGEENHISMAFLYNPPSLPFKMMMMMKKKKTISLGEQALFILILSLFYIFYSN